MDTVIWKWKWELSSRVNRERKGDSHKNWCFPRHWQKVTGRRARELEEENVYLCFCLTYFTTAVGETKALPNEILAENWHERPGIRPWNAGALLTNKQCRLSWLLTNTEINLICCRQQDPGTADEGKNRSPSRCTFREVGHHFAAVYPILFTLTCVCVYTNSHTLTPLKRLVYSCYYSRYNLFRHNGCKYIGSLCRQTFMTQYPMRNMLQNTDLKKTVELKNLLMTGGIIILKQ